MQKFSETLVTLKSEAAISKIEIFSQSGALIGKIENKPGSSGSIKVYNHLYLEFGEINAEAALKGLEIFSEYTEEAKINPGSHPNIDRLFDVINDHKVLKIKIIK